MKSENDDKIYIKSISANQFRFNCFNPTHEIIEDSKYRIFIDLAGVLDEDLHREMTESSELVQKEKKKEILIQKEKSAFGQFYLKFKISMIY